jgi:hypothetical protein
MAQVFGSEADPILRFAQIAEAWAKEEPDQAGKEPDRRTPLEPDRPSAPAFPAPIKEAPPKEPKREEEPKKEDPDDPGTIVKHR